MSTTALIFGLTAVINRVCNTLFETLTGTQSLIEQTEVAINV